MPGSPLNETAAAARREGGGCQCTQYTTQAQDSVNASRPRTPRTAERSFQCVVGVCDIDLTQTRTLNNHMSHDHTTSTHLCECVLKQVRSSHDEVAARDVGDERVHLRNLHSAQCMTHAMYA
jgi:hypothetical protein